MAFSRDINNMYTEAPLLVLDSKTEQGLPARFRIIPNYHGIAGIVGSAQFNQVGLEAIIKKITTSHQKHPKKIWLVDLRQETHFFADGQPLSLYGKHNHTNINKSPEQIFKLEAELISSFKQKKESTVVHLILNKTEGIITNTQPIVMHLQKSQSEAALAKKYGLTYKRFYIPDHQKPPQKELINLVDFINKLNKEDWVIVHCRGGKGRTTTFMLLTALIQDKKNHPNAQLNSIESYIAEQISLSGKNLFDLDIEAKTLWKLEDKKSRANFIRQFYQDLL
jgi:predicted protein tyrosine phosphatase